MNGFKAFEMMKEGKIVCVTNCENVGYKFKNGFIVEQNLVIDDEPLRPANFDFNLTYEVFDEIMLENAYIKFTEKELRSLITFLSDCHNYLALDFECMRKKEIKKLYKLKRRLLYDCNFYLRRFDKERVNKYPDFEEIKQFNIVWEKIQKQLELMDEELEN